MSKSEDSVPQGEASASFDDLYEEPSLKRHLPPGFEEDSLLSLDEQEAAAHKRVSLAIPESLTILKPLPSEPEEKEQTEHSNKESSEGEPSCPKVHVGCLPANLKEHLLHAYFSQFGDILQVVLVRDYETGISKGYAFITFANASAAHNALKANPHHLNDAPHMRVSPATSKNQEQTQSKKPPPKLEDIILPDQKRIYIGPLFESVSNEEMKGELGAYGVVKGIVRHPRTTHHLPYVAVEFEEGISLRRAFGQRVSLGNSSRSKVTCSRFIMELLLSPNVLFFHEAYLKTEHGQLEKHFSQFGRVYRAMQFYDTYKDVPKTYGFVDFVESSSLDRALERKTQLGPPGQFLRVNKYLPMHLLMNMCAIGDAEAQIAIRALESVIPDSGVWGENASKFNIQKHKGEVVSSQVRFPVKLVPKLIGERGKTIAEITRDSKCKVIVPKVKEGETNIVVVIRGLRTDIKTAQYLMQKAIKA